jgi:RNA polymerase sigma factor (sigma-70 family)
MQHSGLNNNKDRRKFWESMADEKGDKTLQEALSKIDPTSAQVLTWHYIDGYSFKEIAALLNRSISIVRNHHNRGMFELQQYYINGLTSM